MNVLIKCLVLIIALYESCAYVSRNMAFSVFLCVCNLDYLVPLSLHMCKSMFGSEVIRRVELCFFRPCVKLTSLKNRKPRTSETYHVENANFYLYKPCVRFLLLLLYRLLQSGNSGPTSLWPAGTW